uniref:BPTI/Kunitz inhibitor domain-containing protein n=1 Tax=Bos taurus TaxID=9913 RepID=A0AAA9SSN5_BOVIN
KAQSIPSILRSPPEGHEDEPALPLCSPSPSPGHPDDQHPSGDTSCKDNVLQPHFGLEPPYRGPCKSVNVRYFFNASSTFWEPFVYGGCDAKENNLLRAADLRRTCGGSLGH